MASCKPRSDTLSSPAVPRDDPATLVKSEAPVQNICPIITPSADREAAIPGCTKFCCRPSTFLPTDEDLYDVPHMMCRRCRQYGHMGQGCTAPRRVRKRPGFSRSGRPINTVPYSSRVVSPGYAAPFLSPMDVRMNRNFTYRGSMPGTVTTAAPYVFYPVPVFIPISMVTHVITADETVRPSRSFGENNV